MYKALVTSLLLISLAGCGRHSAPEEAVAASAAGAMPAAPAAEQARAAGAEPQAARQTLAYEHWLVVEAGRDDIRPLYAAALEACRAAAGRGCLVMNAQLTDGEFGSAQVDLRIGHGELPQMVNALSQRGKVVSQSTTAEDVGGPIRDTEKQMAMLRDYRSKLEALLARGSSDIDALIKLQKELATVQSELEARTGERAALEQRVQTEVLHITVRIATSHSSWSALGSAISNFGPTLVTATAALVTALGYALPWLLLLSGVLALRRWRKRKAG